MGAMWTVTKGKETALLGFAAAIVGLVWACAGNLDGPVEPRMESVELARLQANGRSVVIWSTEEGIRYDLHSGEVVAAGLSIEELRAAAPELSLLVEYGYARRGANREAGQAQERSGTPVLDATGPEESKPWGGRRFSPSGESPNGELLRRYGLPR